MRMRQGAAMTVVVLALFLMGQSAHAAWSDWLPWPFSAQSGPEVKTPSAGAQETPPGGVPPPPPPSGDQGFQPQQLPPPPPQNNQQQLPPPQGQQDQQRQFNQQPGQPNQFNQQNPQGQQPGGRFFCNALGREASREECDSADKAKGFQPGQQGDIKPPFPGTDQQQMRPEDAERFRKESEQSRQQIEEKMRQEDKMRREQNQQPQNGQMPFPGQGNVQGQFPGQGATQGNFPGGKEGVRPMMGNGQQNQQPQFNFDEQPQEQRQVFFDPQFVKQVTREISDQTRELNRLLKAAKKVSGGEAAVAEVQELLSKIDDFKSKMKSAQGEDLQSVMDDFHDAQIWDALNGIRAKVELPKQLNEMDRSVKKIEKLVQQKSFKKLATFGIDFAKVTADVASFREKINNVRTLLSSNDAEGAQEAMQEIFQDGHPGEIEGSLQQLRGMTDGLSRIRNKDIQGQVKEIFQPVIDAINSGDYREANEIMNELQPEMQRIFSQLYRLNAKSSLSSDLKKKLDAFDARIQDKLQKQDQSGPQDQETEFAQ